MLRVRVYECSDCCFPAVAVGSRFGLRRPRCPWPWCLSFGLLMQAKDPEVA